MKLTLWQQFSSNHSSSFTVVGRCTSIEKAIEVEQILKTLFAAIKENNDFVYRSKHRLVDDDDGPTYPEVEAGEKYNIEWKRGFDWIDEPDGQVIRFEQYVFATSRGGFDTWQGSETLAKLMSRLAEEVHVEEVHVDEEFVPVNVVNDLSATAPDEKIAAELTDEIQWYLSEIERLWAYTDTVIPPWEIYYPQLHFQTNSADVEPPPDEKADPKFDRTMFQALYRYQKAQTDPQLLKATALEVLRLLTEHGYTVKSEINKQLLRRIINHSYLDITHAYSGQIKRRGSQLLLSDIHFAWAWEGLPALIAYLKDKDCTDIRYTFKSVPYKPRHRQ